MSHATLDPKPDTRLDRGQHEPSRSLAQRGVSCRGIRWHCAWTEVQRERIADEAIRAAGFESFLPLFLERTLCRHTLVVPLWSRYVLCRFDASRDDWGRIKAARGVGGLICHAPATPTPLPDYAITELLARTSARGIVDDPGEAPYVAPGAGWRPVWHGLAGLDAGSRLRLLQRLFGESVTNRALECT
jgi:hypothetical protein